MTTASAESHDFDQLEIVSTRLATNARETQRRAQLAIVQAREPAAPLVTKSAETPPESDGDILARHGKKPVTVAAFFEGVGVLLQLMKTQQERVDRLEQTNTDLSTRVLELEAVLASRAEALP